MSTSAASALEFPGLTTEFEALQPGLVTPSFGEVPSARSSVVPFMPLSAPSVPAYQTAFAAASRLLARLNTTMTPPTEYKDLLAERLVLLDKQYNGSITRQEQNRLEYVRWSIGRIMDAESGPPLDALESIVTAYELFASDMAKFGEQLANASQKTKKGR